MVSNFFRVFLFIPWNSSLSLNALFKIMLIVSSVGIFVKSDSTSKLTTFWLTLVCSFETLLMKSNVSLMM